MAGKLVFISVCIFIPDSHKNVICQVCNLPVKKWFNNKNNSITSSNNNDNDEKIIIKLVKNKIINL